MENNGQGEDTFFVSKDIDPTEVDDWELSNKSSKSSSGPSNDNLRSLSKDKRTEKEKARDIVDSVLRQREEAGYKRTLSRAEEMQEKFRTLDGKNEEFATKMKEIRESLMRNNIPLSSQGYINLDAGRSFPQTKKVSETRTSRIFDLQDALSSIDEKLIPQTYRTMNTLASVTNDFNHVISDFENTKAILQLTTKFSDSEYAIFKREWKREENILIEVLHYFPYANIQKQINHSSRSISLLGNNLEVIGNKKPSTDITYFTTIFNGDEQWVVAAAILKALGEYDIEALAKFGFIIDTPPPGYRNTLSSSEMITEFRRHPEYMEQQKKAASLPSKIAVAQKTKAQEVSVVKIEENKKVSLPQRILWKIPIGLRVAMTPIVTYGTIAALGIPSLNALLQFGTLGMVGGMVGLVGAIAGSTAVMATNKKLCNFLFGDHEGVILGEVVSVEKVPLKAISDKGMDALLTEFISASKDLITETSHSKIVELCNNLRQVYHSDTTDPETKARIELIIEKKIISSFSLFQQAHAIAYDEESRNEAEETLMEHIDKITVEVNDIRKEIFREKIDQMKIQSLYLNPSADKDGSIKLSTKKS